MKVGGFPGREDALRQRLASMEREASARASRRMFLGLAVGGAFGACAGGAAVHATRHAEPATEPPGSVVESPPNPRLEWARKLATGPLDQLMAQQAAFIGEAYDVVSPDDEIWLGVARLANAVVERDSRVIPNLRPALLVLEKKPNLPIQVRHWLNLIRSHGR